MKHISRWSIQKILACKVFNDYMRWIKAISFIIRLCFDFRWGNQTFIVIIDN